MGRTRLAFNGLTAEHYAVLGLCERPVTYTDLLETLHLLGARHPLPVLDHLLTRHYIKRYVVLTETGQNLLNSCNDKKLVAQFVNLSRLAHASDVSLLTVAKNACELLPLCVR